MMGRAIQVSTSQHITHIKFQSYNLSAILILSHISYAVSYTCADRPSARVNPITVSLDDISEQDEVTGTVVRVSNYGVFIDIGAGVDAFLHRRKMKVNQSASLLTRSVHHLLKFWEWYKSPLHFIFISSSHYISLELFYFVFDISHIFHIRVFTWII